MIEEMKCQNKHKMIIDSEGGLISDRPCINKATKYTIDDCGIFYLCEECYQDDYKTKIKYKIYEKKQWQ